MLCITVTLKQHQGYQTWYELVGPKVGYNHAKFERSCFNSVWEKANGKFFPESVNEEIFHLSPLNMCICLKKEKKKKKREGIFMLYMTYLAILQTFNLTGSAHKFF